MIKHLLFLAVVFLGGNLFAAKPAAPAAPVEAPAPSLPQGAAYFFTLELDPRYQYTGTGALTEEDAAHANCYRIDYNSDGKPQQIEYRRAGVAMPDPLLGVPRIDFDYQPGIERRSFHDAQGQPVKDVDGICGEELMLNAAGFPTAVTNLDDTGGHTRDRAGVIKYVRTLDDHNRLIVGRRTGLLGTEITDDSGFFETRTAYDPQGRVMERGNFDASGNPLNNDEGTASIRTTYTLYPDSTLTIESFFDSSGLAVEEKSSGVHQVQRSVDQRGLLLDEAYFDATGAPTVTNDDNIHERRYTYDARGNELTEEFFGTDGKPCNQKDGQFAKVAYKYDDKNRVTEKDYFGDDGAPQVLPNLGAAIIRQSYDDQGNLVRRQFFDGQGAPSAHVQYGVPAIRIKVDGDTTTVSLRNGDDRPMKNPVSGYYSFSYRTATDKPLSVTNKYFDRHGQEMSLLRVKIINPHLHLLKDSVISDYLRSNPGKPLPPYLKSEEFLRKVMLWSAYLGVSGAGIGSLLGCWMALRKSSHTKRRKVYVPTPWERFFGWFAVFAILEGSLRFFMTVYWCWIVYENGQMGIGFHVVETIFVFFFMYRLYRMTVTMRVLNIGREDIHRLIRDFFAKVNLKPEWIASRNRYITAPLDVRVNYFAQKFHAYLAFEARGPDGHSLAAAMAQNIRAQAANIQAPERSAGIALYYPFVAVSYFLLACTAFYTLFQVIKGF
jgi:hypothetical protein